MPYTGDEKIYQLFVDNVKPDISKQLRAISVCPDDTTVIGETGPKTSYVCNAGRPDNYMDNSTWATATKRNYC